MQGSGLGSGDSEIRKLRCMTSWSLYQGCWFQWVEIGISGFPGVFKKS